MKQTNKTVKIIFGFRILMWVIAAGATIYWIYWSFHLYNIGIHIIDEYAAAFRPLFYKSVLVSVVAILISLKLRSISDGIKKKEEDIRNGRV